MIFWIASYPKSGNTWLRALLSSYYYSEDGCFNQKLLENIGQFPEKKYLKSFNYNSKIASDTSRFWIKAQEIINRDSKIKFFKTHNILGAIDNNKFTNEKNSIGGLYVVRDPRNVITSIQNHYELKIDEALKFMLSETKFIFDRNTENDFSDFQFISSWEKNYQSWIRQKIFPIKIVKYEDLNNKTFEVFKEIIRFIDSLTENRKNFNKLKAKNSIETTTFSKMKKIEEENGFVESVLSKNDTKKIPFFHLGPNNNWKNILDQKYQNKLNIEFRNNLKELDYI